MTKKISEMTAAGTITGAETIPVLQAGSNVALTILDLTSTYATTVTAGATTTLDVTSMNYQNFTGTLAQTVVLPVVSTLRLGRSFMIMNNGTGLLTVNSSGGNLVGTVLGGGASIMTCQLITGTDAASWDVLTICPVSGPGSGQFNAGTFKATTTIGVGGATPSASGSGVSFPATQSASTDPNTLDDYEEGTFTPGITFGGASVGVTYTTATGSYTKIGNRVLFSLFMILSSKGSSVGAIQITGLPFTSDSSFHALSIYANNMSVTLTQFLMCITSSSTAVMLIQKLVAGNADSVYDSDCTNSTVFSISGSYKV